MGSDNYGSHFKFSWSIGTSLIRYGMRSIFNGCIPCIPPNSLESRQDCMDKLEKDGERSSESKITTYDDFETPSSSDIEEKIPIEDIEEIEDIEDIEGAEKGKHRMVYVVKEKDEPENEKKNPENTSCTTQTDTPEVTPPPTPPTSPQAGPQASPQASPCTNHVPSSQQGSESPIRIREPLSTGSSDSDWVDINEVNRENDE